MNTKLIISGLAFLVITTLASGQYNGVNSQLQNGTANGTAYVDAHSNGICDNYKNLTSNTSPDKESVNCNCCGQGHRQGQGQNGCCQREGRGRNYIDADKNGICDHRDTRAKK
jgi:hypothetical protein